MSSVARPDVENLPGQCPSCQREDNGRPRHGYSMRLLGHCMCRQNPSSRAERTRAGVCGGRTWRLHERERERPWEERPRSASWKEPQVPPSRGGRLRASVNERPRLLPPWQLVQSCEGGVAAVGPWGGRRPMARGHTRARPKQSADYGAVGPWRRADREREQSRPSKSPPEDVERYVSPPGNANHPRECQCRDGAELGSDRRWIGRAMPSSREPGDHLFSGLTALGFSCRALL